MTTQVTPKSQSITFIKYILLRLVWFVQTIRTVRCVYSMIPNGKVKSRKTARNTVFIWIPFVLTPVIIFVVFLIDIFQNREYLTNHLASVALYTYMANIVAHLDEPLLKVYLPPWWQIYTLIKIASFSAVIWALIFTTIGLFIV